MSYPTEIVNELAAAGPGQVRKFEAYRSKFLPAERDVIVYVPGIYDRRQDLRFPVIYMQDGQNLFDPATSFGGVPWRMGETADRLIAAGSIQPIIIVGIYNTGKQRLREYTPSRAPKQGGGGANRYRRMLIEEIKPFIESEFRTLPGPQHTAVGGSSLGGLLSLYVGLRFSKVFGKVAALSPSIWWDRRWIVNFASRSRFKSRPRIWLDSGTQEGGHTVDDTRKMRDVLLRKGWREGQDLLYLEVQGGQHNEAAWADRVGPFLQFLFPSGEPAV